MYSEAYVILEVYIFIKQAKNKKTFFNLKRALTQLHINYLVFKIYVQLFTR